MLHFICNPVAGRGKSLKAWRRIESQLRGVPHALYETQSKGHARVIARTITEAPGEKDIVAMGGDGTLHEVLNGLADPARVRLGLIPCGSGNDFASAANIPTAPLQALALVLRGRAKATDYLECSGVRGINAIGAGIDVDILRRYARMKLLRSSAAYLAALVSTVLTYRAKVFEDVTGASPVAHSALIACAGNGHSIGGGIPICPDAALDDGLMDVVIIDGISRIAIPAAFSKLMRRRVADIPTAGCSRRTALRVTSEAPMPVQVDGEIYEDLPFDVKLIHGALRVFRP